jgi:hypothetical protein
MLTSCASSADAQCPVSSTEVGGVVNGQASSQFRQSAAKSCTYSISNSSVASVDIEWVAYAGSGFRGEASSRKFGYTDMPAANAAKLGEPALVNTFKSDSSSPDGSSWVIFNHDGYAWSVGVIGVPNDTSYDTMAWRAFSIAQLISAKSYPKP